MSDNTSAPHTPPAGGAGAFGQNTVSRIGYGAMQLDRLRAHRDDAIAIVRRAVELGITHFDTAQFYGNGFVNGVLADALRPSDQVTVVTKIGADPVDEGPLPMRSAQRPEELRASVEANLRALRVDHIPIVNIRRMDTAHAVPAAEDQVVDIDDQLAEMIAMRDEGLIGGIGLSSTTLEVLQKALPAGIAGVQNAYSLLDRSDEDMLHLTAAAGLAWVPYFPLGSAFPGLPKVVDNAAVQAIAAVTGATPAQVGLTWLLQHSPNILLIPGTASIDHLADNVAIGSVTLTDEMITRIDEASEAPAAS